MKICKVDGCEKVIGIKRRSSMCSMHRTRWQRRKTLEPSQKALNRFKPVKNVTGYVRVNKGNGRVLEHVWMVEQHIGRKLTSDECVHHINGVKHDNRLENLQLMTKSEHMTLHGYARKIATWARKHTSCVECGTTDIKHRGRGFCIRCYGFWFRHKSKA